MNDTPWLLVAGDLTPLGGMDAANHALARYLALTVTSELHLVTHRAWPDLAALRTVTVHRVWRPFNRHLLGSPLLSRTGRRVWNALAARGAKAVVNGGNCRVAAANWVHYLHAAYEPSVAGSFGQRAKSVFARRRDLAAEHTALRDARVVISNSRRTKRDVVERLQIPEDRVHVIYYGSDPIRFSHVDARTRLAAKRTFGFSTDRPLIGFVGALGDRRKAFDMLFDAFAALSRVPEWDADLVVVGTGAELPSWKARAQDANLDGRIHFLGFRADVPDVMAAFDALVHPARYEAYGLSVHEALCRGVPALVSRSAGVAEHYPTTVAELLIANPDDRAELAERLLNWRRGMERFRELVLPISETLRARSWDSMAREIEECVRRTT